MKRIIVIFPMLITTTILFTGCSEDVNSEDIRTSGMYADMLISASGSNKVFIDVTLLVGGSSSNTYVELNSTDSLWAKMEDGEAVKLGKSENSIGQISYYTYISDELAIAENTKFTIMLNRSNGVSATDSNVTMPAPITSFTSDKSIFDRSSEELVLTWDTHVGDNSIMLEYIGDCVGYRNLYTEDTGIYTFEANSIQYAQEEDRSDQNCEVTFTLHRIKEGIVDPNFGEGGNIEAKQKVALTINSVP